MRQQVTAAVVLVAAVAAVGCGKEGGVMSPSSTVAAAGRSGVAVVETIPATAMRFEAFLNDNLYDRAAVALGPESDGFGLKAYNLGAQGYTLPVATIRVVVRYDATAITYQGAVAVGGWTVAEDQSHRGLVTVVYRSTSGNVVGDRSLGRLRFTIAKGAIAGDTMLEFVNDWTAGGSIAYDKEGQYSFVNDFGGGIVDLTGIGTDR